LNNFFQKSSLNKTRLVLDRFQDSSKTGSGINIFAAFLAAFCAAFFATFYVVFIAVFFCQLFWACFLALF